ncbi:MAG TPA: hypothetical protein VGQ65_08665 [Thermoanaerobaculia bacterium]|jgi:hypothetical protein|nr:hypothetical protein [Thermoanaerobaculia bacterium]
MRIPVGLACIFVSVAITAQQNPYLGKGSIGKVEKKHEDSFGPGTLAIENWVGERFILLPQPSKLREYGYQLFEPHLDYASWAGKILTVTAVEKDTLPRVHFKTDDGVEVLSTAYSDTIDGIAPIRDLDYARQRWLGKSLWLRRPEIATYDEDSDQYGSIRLGRTAHVKVKSIVAGWYDHEPVRFILFADDGREGFVDLQLSGTNVSAVLRNATSFQEYFSETDPRLTHRDWPPRVWKAIADEKIFIGMSTAQLRMSWGDPSAVNRTSTKGTSSEQWVYGTGNYVYVRNGVVTTIQN